MQTLLNLLASVALLVWGTHIVRTGILRVYGANLRRVLAKSVSNRGSAFLAGLAVTSLVQSSSATALIAGSFVGQNLIALAPALAIMLGADVGTALMAQVFSLDLSWLSPLFIFFGVVFFLARKNTKAGQIGRVAIGIGLMILALQLIQAAAKPIVSAAGTKTLFASLSGDPMLDVLIGALFAVFSWSSLAVVLLAATLAASAVITVPVAACLVLGANLGSGLIGVVSTLGVPGGGRRVAIGNLVFKLAGCVGFGLFLALAMKGIAQFDDDPRRQVLHFHVLFNVTLAAVFLFLTGPIADLVTKWFPDSPVPGAQSAQPRHLDEAALATPALALANAARETLRIGDTIEHMLDAMIETIRTNDAKKADEAIRLDDDVDRLYTAVKLYLTQISREALDEKDGARWAEIISLTINLEHVGDVIERILTDVKDKKIDHKLSFSEAGMRELEDLHAKLVANLRLGLSVFLTGDAKSAEMLLAEKEKFRDLERSYAAQHLDRLADQTVQSIETSSLHLDIISDMRRINSFFCSTAYPILERSGQLRKSRLRGAGKGEATGAFAKGDLAPGAK